MNELILIIIFLTMILAGGLLLIFFLAVNQNKNNKDEISNLSEKLESTLNSISKNMENNYFKQSQLSNKQFTDIFTKLAIIDNANNLEETSLNNSLLKRSEENITKINKDQNDINSISNTKFNNQNELSNEELLYDEFNYLLDE